MIAIFFLSLQLAFFGVVPNSSFGERASRRKLASASHTMTCPTSPLVLPPRRKLAASPTASSNVSPSSLNPNLRLVTTQQQVRTEWRRSQLEGFNRNCLLFSRLSTPLVPVTCSPVPYILVWGKTPWYLTLSRERRWWTQGWGCLTVFARPSLTIMLSQKNLADTLIPIGVPGAEEMTLSV